MQVDEKKFANLEAVATKLNEASGDLPAAIEALNNKLAKTNLHMEMWGAHLDESTGIGDGDISYTWSKQLGYAEWRGEWQLCVRLVTRTLDEKCATQGIPTALAKESSSLMIEACDNLEHFIDQLESKAKRIVESVEKVKALA